MTALWWGWVGGMGGQILYLVDANARAPTSARIHLQRTVRSYFSQFAAMFTRSRFEGERTAANIRTQQHQLIHTCFEGNRSVGLVVWTRDCAFFLFGFGN